MKNFFLPGVSETVCPSDFHIVAWFNWRDYTYTNWRWTRFAQVRLKKGGEEDRVSPGPDRIPSSQEIHLPRGFDSPHHHCDYGARFPYFQSHCFFRTKASSCAQLTPKQWHICYANSCGWCCQLGDCPPDEGIPCAVVTPKLYRTMSCTSHILEEDTIWNEETLYNVGARWMLWECLISRVSVGWLKICDSAMMKRKYRGIEQ